MKQPKWITAIEVTDHWEPGYWVERGWDPIAQMKSTSVIDVVGMNMDIIEAGKKKMVVPIGGIAHAGARGISKVELQVDNGPWQPAVLRTPLSHLTWVIWRYEWPFQHGKHTFISALLRWKRARRKSSPKLRRNQVGQLVSIARHRCFDRRGKNRVRLPPFARTEPGWRHNRRCSRHGAIQAPLVGSTESITRNTSPFRR